MTRRLAVASLVSIPLLQQCAAAQQPTESTPVIQLYDFDRLPLEAFILGAQNGTTTAKLVCNPNSDAAGCGPLPQNTYTFGPGIFRVQGGLDGQYTFTTDCSTAPHTAVCKYFESDDVAVLSHSSTVTNFTKSYTTTYGSSDITMYTVPIVSGLDKLPTTSTSAAATSASSPSPTQVASTSSTSSSPTSTVSDSSATDTISHLDWLLLFCAASFTLM